ncbi:MAG: GDCCVxC domain-containing (seleno)protein [Rhodomicrobiaceae bacterium]
MAVTGLTEGGSTLRPIGGDCCVFCSCGSVKCPPVQTVGMLQLTRFFSPEVFWPPAQKDCER